VPCIIRYPGEVGAGGRIAGMAEGVDLVPTLLEYAGVVRQPSLQGRSMRPLLEGDEAAARDSVYCEFASPSRSNWAAVRTEQWFYARNAFGGEMLHDLQADPHELRNIADEAKYSAALSEMRALALERSLHARPGVRLEARY
jgi:arylsulfatase A-like enzyme